MAVTVSPVRANYELVTETRDGGSAVDTYRHRQAGELIYVGRPDVVQAPARYRELANELQAIETMTDDKKLEAASGFLARAAQLVDDTRHIEPGPLMLQGIGARLLNRWDVAEQAFRTVTTLRPTFLSAWQDLTGALANLGRLEEAEVTARHAVAMAPDDHASLGNLANVLRERGNLDEALTVITRATELHPGDHMNELLLEQIRNARRKTAIRRRLPW